MLRFQCHRLWARKFNHIPVAAKKCLNSYYNVKWSVFVFILCHTVYIYIASACIYDILNTDVLGEVKSLCFCMLGELAGYKHCILAVPQTYIWVHSKLDLSLPIITTVFKSRLPSGFSWMILTCSNKQGGYIIQRIGSVLQTAGLQHGNAWWRFYFFHILKSQNKRKGIFSSSSCVIHVVWKMIMVNDIRWSVFIFSKFARFCFVLCIHIPSSSHFRLIWQLYCLSCPAPGKRCMKYTFQNAELSIVYISSRLQVFPESLVFT